MYTDADVLSMLMARQPGYSLAQPFYTDADVFDADMRNIFYRDWLMAGAASGFTKTGSYLTMRIGAYAILIVRGADGEIRAFHNSCRHRGSRLCSAEQGVVAKIVCPYHQWTYELDGRLLFARDMGADFDASQWGLKPVHCKVIEGIVFICVAAIAPDIAPMAAQAARYAGPHAVADTKVAHRTSIIEKGNWKLVLENNRECYHCAGSHPSLCRTYPDNPLLGGAIAGDPAGQEHIERCEAAGLPSAYCLDPHQQWRFTRIPFIGDAVSFTMDGRPSVKKRLGTVPFDNAGTCMFFHYPNSWNHFLSDVVMLFSMNPISAMETEVTTTWLVHKDAVEGVDYDLDRLTEVWIHTNDEDRVVVQENQVGIQSPAYTPGRYSELQESGVIQFIDWYADTMQRRLTGRGAMAAE